MFSRSNVCVRIANIAHRQMERDEEEIALVELTCEVNPFTPELAGDLHDFVKRSLFTAAGVEVNSLLQSSTFAIEIRPQSVAFRMAPDQREDSFTLAEAKVGVIKAKRSKKTSTWVLEFTLTCAPASEHQLAQIVECYLKAKYLTFENAVATLFDETPREAPDDEAAETPAVPPKRRRGSNGSAGEVTAH